MGVVRQLGVCCLFLGWAASLMAGRIDPEAAAVLERARAFIGPETALRAVETIVTQGREASLLDPENPVETQFTAIVSQPGYQRVQGTNGTSTFVTGVDGLEAWVMRFANDDPTARTVQPIGGVEMLRMRINATENVRFFHAYKAMRGRVTYVGEQSYAGTVSHVLDFSFPRGIVYRRYFSAATGELLATEMGELTLIESDRRDVRGLQIPHRIEQYRDGELIGFMQAETVIFNADLAEDIFRFPG